MQEMLLRWFRLGLMVGVAGLAATVWAAEAPGPIRFKLPQAAVQEKKDEPASSKAEPTLTLPRKNALREGQSDSQTGLREAAVSAAPAKPAASAFAEPREGPAAGPVLLKGPNPSGTDPSEKPARPPAERTLEPGASLQPIAEPAPGGPVEVEAASFNGVTPGSSTRDEVEKAWGKPKEIKSKDEVTLHLYRIDPFERVEAVFAKDRLTSIVIRLARSFPADGVARQLELSAIRPVLVSNDLGEILGQAYPERGVAFSFEPSPTPGKATMKVSQIVLEPITAEPFLLRAETVFDVHLEASLRDLDQVLKLAPNNGRAQWLRARLLAIQGDQTKAILAADEAVRLDPKDAQYRVTRAQLLGQLGRNREAIQEAEKAVDDSGQRPHIKARAQCLLGDLTSSGPQPDYRKAIDYHSQAIKTADALTKSPHPAIRLPAKEVLIDAHLGAAHDIAWGNWSKKETTVPVWLKQAAAFAEEMIQNDGGAADLRFRVATRALAACVGAQGKIDPADWTDQVLRIGQELLLAAPEPAQKQQVQWEVGLALYDVVQIQQMRGQRDLAMKFGKQAIDYLEQGSQAKSPESPDRYLLGRLYFRMGSIYAIGQRDHKEAIAWFDKAQPVLEKSASQVTPAERGRLGETLVSMAVSYWETGQRDKAVSLTRQGIEFLQQSVKTGAMQASALEIPQANLATMQRQLSGGRTEKSEERLETAGKKGHPLR